MYSRSTVLGLYALETEINSREQPTAVVTELNGETGSVYLGAIYGQLPQMGTANHIVKITTAVLTA